MSDGSRRTILLASVLCGVLTSCVTAAAETITNDEFNFTLTVPAGFIRLPDEDGAIYTFGTSDPADGVPDVVVRIESLDAEIGRESLKGSKALPPDARVVAIRWKTFDVELVSYAVETDELTFATRTVQLPLRGRAIQIIVVSPSDKAREANRAMSAFVAGVDGRASWLTPYDYGERLGYAVATIVVGVCVLAYLVRRANRRQVLQASVPHAGADAHSHAQLAERYIAGTTAAPDDTHVARHRRALRVAVYAVVTTFGLVVVMSVAVILLGLGAPVDAGNPVERVGKILWGTARLCATAGLLAYGAARLVFRVRHGRPALTPSAYPAAARARDTARAEAAAKLEHVEEE